MGFLRVWFLGIISPSRAYDILKDRKVLKWGFYAVLIRFLGTSFTTILLLFLMGYKPFQPSYLTFLDTKNYYKAEIFFMPVFGLFIWLLMSGVSHLFFQLWETGLECTGFSRIQKLRVSSALGIALLINALYISVAVVFIR